MPQLPVLPVYFIAEGHFALAQALLLNEVVYVGGRFCELLIVQSYQRVVLIVMAFYEALLVTGITDVYHTLFLLLPVVLSEAALLQPLPWLFALLLFALLLFSLLLFSLLLFSPRLTFVFFLFLF